ncbi:DNA-binding protein [Sansalvadorimonas verongulae]|nr:DNA-binding protein [Sansalvadorimonas verongulae]
MGDLKLYEPEDVAKELGITKGTLTVWRSMGKGPKFVKVGRFPKYREADVIEWLNSRVREIA